MKHMQLARPFSFNVVGSRCPHGRTVCQDCGKNICIHGRSRYRCIDCGTGICQHGLTKQACRTCSPHLYCEHKRYKTRCTFCRMPTVFQEPTSETRNSFIDFCGWCKHGCTLYEYCHKCDYWDIHPIHIDQVLGVTLQVMAGSPQEEF